MLKAYKYRIYPNSQQSELINKHIGSCRFVYNLALETKQTAYAGNKINLSCFDLIKQIPDLKKECTWLSEINSQSIQQSITHLDNAFTRFFKGQGDFPKLKKKTARQSFNVPQYVIVDFEKNKLIIPKFKKVGIDIVLHRKFKGIIKQATISKTPTGKYFASILVETGIEVPKKKVIKESTTSSIDLGLKNFIVTSEGTVFDNPKFLRKSISKIKYLQKRVSKYKGKNNKKRLASVHEKVANQRKDFLHKTSSNIINNHDSICVEDLNINGMMRRCKPNQDENENYVANGQSAKSGLNKSIGDAGWGMFVSMLEYKAEFYGKNILKIGRFDASSKTCSGCGKIKHDLTLKDRIFECDSCDLVIDRDLNAAINIKNFGLKNHKKLSVGRRLKNRKELPTLVGVLTSEASTPLG